MTEALRPYLDELVPVARRAVALDPKALVRIRAVGRTVAIYARLPFRVLVSRAVDVDADLPTLDRTVAGADLLAWADADSEAGNTSPPVAHDAEWRGALPPTSGWRRLDQVPDDVIRPLIRSGALALKDAAQREGVPGAQPRAEVADALLDAVVLTVTDDTGARADVQLRTVSSLVRMGFVPRGSVVTVDAAGRWIRISGEYGSAYAEGPGGLSLR